MSEAQKDNILEDEDALVDVDDSSMAGEESVTLSIAKNETRVVAIFRVILFVVLVAVATGASLLAFFDTKNDEMEDFEASFEGHAAKVRRWCLETAKEVARAVAPVV